MTLWETYVDQLLNRLLDKTDKADAIAVLVDSSLGELARELAYRIWCRVHGVELLRHDVDRVRQARRRELQRTMLER